MLLFETDIISLQKNKSIAIIALSGKNWHSLTLWVKLINEMRHFYIFLKLNEGQIQWQVQCTANHAVCLTLRELMKTKVALHDLSPPLSAPPQKKWKIWICHWSHLLCPSSLISPVQGFGHVPTMTSSSTCNFICNWNKRNNRERPCFLSLMAFVWKTQTQKHAPDCLHGKMRPKTDGHWTCFPSCWKLGGADPTSKSVQMHNISVPIQPSC